MHLTPTQSIALLLVGALAIWAFCALIGIIDGAWDAWQESKDERQYRRHILQDNLRELIHIMINTGEEDQEALRLAFVNTLVEYRKI